MENEGLCQGEIQISVALCAVVLFHFEEVISHKWLSSASGIE